MGRLVLGVFFLLFIFSCKKKQEVLVINTPSLKVPVAVKPINPIPVLILDAGHGGEDPGAVSDSFKLKEKNVTRSIVDAVLANIDQKKIKVIQTRLKDDNTHRHKRIEIANQYNPDLLLTVHINFDKDTTVNGYEMQYNDSILDRVIYTDTLKRNNPYKKKLNSYSALFNKKIGQAFPDMKLRGITLRKDRIWMIFAGNYPSLLLEFGFINNRHDAKIMADKKNIKKLAQVIVKCIYEILLDKPV
jgi:N-acetylmuramoyl-L-alanine amidase